MKLLSSHAAVALSCLGTASSLQAAYPTFSISDFNLIVFENILDVKDVEGRTFVGGGIQDAGSANYGINYSSSAGQPNLVVGGDIVAGNPLQLNSGSLHIRGAVQGGRLINFNGGGAKVTDPAIDITPTKTAFLEYSTAWQAIPADSSVSIPTQQPGPAVFNATPGADGIAVFHVAAADLFDNNKVQQIQLNAPADTKVVVNVSGTTVNWDKSGNFVGSFTQDYWQANVTWNFHQATTLKFGGKNFHGGVLAPFGTLSSQNNVDGGVVVKSLNSQGEIHLPASSLFPHFPPAVPEASNWLAGGAIVGLGGLALARRRVARG
jgi:choice-of-anchor A domain-containing protein